MALLSQINTAIIAYVIHKMAQSGSSEYSLLKTVCLEMYMIWKEVSCLYLSL